MRLYVNYLQNDWSDLLLLAEFAYNNLSSVITKHLPFFANVSFHPHFNALSVQLAYANSSAFNAKTHAALIHNIHKSLKKNITAA
jgi:hypothetical protein